MPLAGAGGGGGMAGCDVTSKSVLVIGVSCCMEDRQVWSGDFRCAGLSGHKKSRPGLAALGVFATNAKPRPPVHTSGTKIGR